MHLINKSLLLVIIPAVVLLHPNILAQSILLNPQGKPDVVASDNLPSNTGPLASVNDDNDLAVTVGDGANADKLLSVKVSSQNEGKTVDFSLNNTKVQYKTLVLKNPTRLVVDLVGVKPSAAASKTVSFALGKIRIGKHADKTRIVIDFQTADVPSYQISLTNKTLSMNFSGLYQPLNLAQVNNSSMSQAAGSDSLAIVPIDSTLKQSVIGSDKDGDVIKTMPVANQYISLPAPKFSNKQISVDFRNAEIRNVLRFMADSSGYNIVAGENINGRVTIQLKNVPWSEAFKSILQVSGLGFSESGGIIRVLPLGEMEKEQNSRLTNNNLAEDNLPLMTRLIPVNYSTAESLLSQINGMLSSRGKVSVNERTNVLVVSDVKPKIEQIDQLVQSLDTQTPQILIEARLVEASTQFSRSLGVQWGGSFFGVKGGSPVGAPGPVGTSVPAAAAISNKNYAVNFPVENAPASIGFSMGSLGNMAVLNARLSAAENDGQAKTVSMPKIMTLDNKAARITQGFRLPYSVINSSVTQTQFIDAALELSVTPHATSDGSVRMSINITQNSPDFEHPNPLGIPPIKIKEATTELLVKDGDTAVIGGIFTRSVSSGDNSVPGLSKIPILGWLFKSSNKSEDQSELLVFLTPRLMNRQMSTIDTSLKSVETETKNK